MRKPGANSFRPLLKKEEERGEREEEEGIPSGILRGYQDIISEDVMSSLRSFDVFKRKVFLHVGPTNSGKTYNALKRLSGAYSGIYCAPLRLLAHEIFDKLNSSGIACNLLTGQRSIKIPNARHLSATVEMADLRNIYEVGIVDEIQMIADESRGHSWTCAFLEMKSKELHLCGDPIAEGLVRKLTSSDFGTGEELIVNRYERLSPLVAAKKPLKRDFENLTKGDAIVVFNRRDIYKIRGALKRKGKSPAVVYGALPPESRNDQAAMFNDPKSSVILVATDAIGMGLNLNLQRIIFQAVEKFDGTTRRYLTPTEVKQIAGRAGRYGSEFPNGIVQAYSKHDLSFIKQALSVEVPQLSHASAPFPTIEHLSDLADQYGGEIPFSTLLWKCLEVRASGNTSSDLFFFSDHKEVLDQALLLDEISEMRLEDRYVFVLAPVDLEDDLVASYFLNYALDFSYSKRQSIRFLLQRALRSKGTSSRVSELETRYKIADLYLWLAMRFPRRFTDSEQAEVEKTKITTSIQLLLSQDYLERSSRRQKFKPIFGRNLRKRYTLGSRKA